MKELGYRIHMHYLWIPDYRLAIERIKGRVREGGHNIPDSIIKRRFEKTLKNLFHIYLPLTDYLTISDNSFAKSRVVFEKSPDSIRYFDEELCRKIMKEAGWHE